MINEAIRAAVVVVLLAFQLAGVAWADPVTVTDKSGRTVTVEAPVRRAILFETYEVTSALGAWDRGVGISRYAFDNDLVKAGRPGLRAEVADGGAMADVNVEHLLALNPDLVVVWSLNPGLVSFLEGKGIPVIVCNPESPQEVMDALRLQGRLFDRRAEAERAAGAIRAMLDKVAARTRDMVPADRRHGLWMLGKPTVVGARNSVAARIMVAAGIDNVAGDIPESWAEVPVERILAWNPDIVFIWGWARFEAGDIVSGGQWQNLTAARRGTVWKTPRWSTWSPRLAPMALWMASKAYPDRFRDVDVRGEIDSFFRAVYGIPYDRVSPLDP
ncbi:MAG: ABC transporter substrate-binding protein [Telmatospirillum sp.]|nr:ABC transporter substrate-binding protein [Telmatospirillum sp.]